MVLKVDWAVSAGVQMGLRSSQLIVSETGSYQTLSGAYASFRLCTTLCHQELLITAMPLEAGRVQFASRLLHSPGK